MEAIVTESTPTHGIEPELLCYLGGMVVAPALSKPVTLRHSAVVRVTHWITVIAFFALLVSGVEIVISHPRFYWGETGNVNTRPLFTLPILHRGIRFLPATATCCPTRMAGAGISTFRPHGLAVLTGLVYVICESVDRPLPERPIPGAGR